MESFAARFPSIYLDNGFKGWFVSSLLLLAWFGSLLNGPLADRFGRKGSMLMAVVVFTIGSAIQAGAISVGMVFAGMFIRCSNRVLLFTNIVQDVQLQDSQSACLR